MKKQWIVSGIVGLMFLLVLTSFLSFRLGKQSNRTTEEENAEAEALCFGNKSIVLSPMTNGALCDFSTQDIPFSLVSLADDLLEQIAGLEQVEEASVC